jgi:hypothetical protein
VISKAAMLLRPTNTRGAIKVVWVRSHGSNTPSSAAQVHTNQQCYLAHGGNCLPSAAKQLLRVCCPVTSSAHILLHVLHAGTAAAAASSHTGQHTGQSVSSSIWWQEQCIGHEPEQPVNQRCGNWLLQQQLYNSRDIAAWYVQCVCNQAKTEFVVSKPHGLGNTRPSQLVTFAVWDESGSLCVQNVTWLLLAVFVVCLTVMGSHFYACMWLSDSSCANQPRLGNGAGALWQSLDQRLQCGRNKSQQNKPVIKQIRHIQSS